MSSVLLAPVGNPASLSESRVTSVQPILSAPQRCQRAMASRADIYADGSNLIFHNQTRPRFEVLLAIASDVIAKGFDLGCIFDGSVTRRLREEQGVAQADACEYLLSRYRNTFTKVSCIKADVFLLALADRYVAQVISDDMYRPYEGDYDWLKDEGRIIPVNVFRDEALVGSEWVDIDNDLDRSMSKLEKLLNEGSVS